MYSAGHRPGSMRFMHTVVNVAVRAADVFLIGPVLAFFGSHFEVHRDEAADAVATLRVRRYGEFDRRAFAGADFAPVAMRKSSAASFNLHGLRAGCGGLEVVDCESTGTAFVFDAAVRTIDLYLSAGSEIQVVEFLRDLVIRHEERCGTLVLHAAAAVGGPAAVVLVGGKGAGKSTLLLDLLSRPGWRFLSGDKAFLTAVDGTVQVTGWPDYPHLGVGTLRGHPALVRALRALGHDIAGAADQKKVLFRPEVLRAALGFDFCRGTVPLGWVAFPAVREPGAAGTERVAPDPAAVLEGLEFSARNPLGGWHSFLAAPDPAAAGPAVARLADALGRCRYCRVVGTEPLGAAEEEMLRC